MERANQPELLRITQVLDLYPVSRSRWYAGVKVGDYPQPIRLGKRSVAWFKSDILDLIEAQRLQAE